MVDNPEIEEFFIYTKGGNNYASGTFGGGSAGGRAEWVETCVPSCGIPGVA